MVKYFLKKAAERLPLNTLERISAYAVLRNVFPSVQAAPRLASREELHRVCIEKVVGSGTAITYLEFGVYQGDSIRRISSLNTNPDSIFIGLDSFEGLPEDWTRKHPKGHFDVGGNIPKIDDPRVSFLKGWFQDSWGELQRRISGRSNFVVHYDADLYSSTLFVLTSIHSVGQPYIAIFDEFAGQEARALYNYIQAYGASVVFHSQVASMGYPFQVLCRLDPSGTRRA
jgi:O-methyltransferase